jgi:hypothetical protein
MTPFSGGVGPLDEPVLEEPDEDDEEDVLLLLPPPVVLPPELVFPPVLLPVPFSPASVPLAQATPRLAAATTMPVARERVLRLME